MNRLLVWTGCLLTLLGSAVGPAGAVTIQILPDAAQVPEGNSFGVAIRISGLAAPGAPSLGVFDLDLSFDPAILSYSGVTFGDPVNGDQLDVLGLGSISADSAGVGSVNLFELSLDSPALLDSLQIGSFVLGTVTFQAVAPGTSSLSLALNAVGDSLGASIPDIDVFGAAVEVTRPIPEPSGFLLFSAGLAVVYRDRKRTRA